MANVFISAILVISIAQITPSLGKSVDDAAVTTCYVQHCLNCLDTEAPGTPVICNRTNYVSPLWLQSATVPKQTASPEINSGYRCIKFTSTSNTDNSTLPHLIRGCSTGDSMDAQLRCIMLSSSENFKGRTGNCSICEGNNCNSANSDNGVPFLLALAILAKITGIWL